VFEDPIMLKAGEVEGIPDIVKKPGGFRKGTHVLGTFNVIICFQIQRVFNIFCTIYFYGKI
jgi:hypothetical protein